MIHPILLRLSVAIYWSVRHLFYMYHMMKMTIGLSESDNFKFIELNKSGLI